MALVDECGARGGGLRGRVRAGGLVVAEEDLGLEVGLAEDHAAFFFLD